MADLRNGCPTDAEFKEAVCVDVGRIYDSCCDRDCLEDLRCFFCPKTQSLINNASSIRLRSAQVLNVYIDVEPITFNKGFFSCDLTFYFLLCFDLFTAPNTCPQQITGTAIYNKKVILFGSEGNVKTFSNVAGAACEEQSVSSTNTPKCVVSTVDPVPLSAHLGKVHNCYENVCCIPKCVCDAVGGEIVTDLPDGDIAVYATIGLFTVVQLIRNVQMLIPVYDFCIPEKTCNCSTVHPCDTFNKIKFPTDDFFPPRACDIDNGNCCGGTDVCDE